MPSIAYQLYSSRNWSMEETFAMLARLGIGAVEGYGPYVDDPDKTKSLLDQHGIGMPTCHFGLDLVEQDPDRVIRIARELGIEAVVVPYLAAEDRPTSEPGWAQFAKRLAQAGAPIIASGLDFAWHNHDFELAPVDGIMPLDLIAAASTDIKIELDLAWVKVAGHDPVVWLEKLAGRLVAAHIKDIAPAGENSDEDGWADVGRGIMDWRSIKPALDAAGVDKYIIEHDNPSDHERMARRSLASVKAF
ncbi:MAG: sugar phosphate isomerase/epimerase [Pseudomonadota bacterium]